MIELLADLDVPWGLVVHPWRPDAVLLTERDGGDGGRVLEVDLCRRTRRVLSGAREGLHAPESLAAERSGGRLLVSTASAPGSATRVLRLLDLEGAAGGRVAELATYPGTQIGALATGPNGLRLVALLDGNNLAVGGGVEQRRSVESFDVATETATVSPAFDPPLGPGEPRCWRVRNAVYGTRYRTSTSARGDAFVWDTSDVLGGGDVAVRVLSFDTDPGSVDGISFPRRVRSPLSVEPLTRNAGFVEDNIPLDGLAAADLDMDGDVDIVYQQGRLFVVERRQADGSYTFAVFTDTGGTERLDIADMDEDGRNDVLLGDPIRVRYQEPTPDLAFSPGVVVASTVQTRMVQAADVNGDGRVDVVGADLGARKLLLVPGTAPRSFGTPISLVGDPGAAPFGPVDASLGDLDADGDLDLVAADEAGDTLWFFLQPSSGFVAGAFPDGSFSGGNGALGGPIPLSSPVAVTLVDLDLDGGLDVLSANRASDNATAFLRPGSASSTSPDFELRRADVADSAPSALSVADLDANGWPDVVLVHEGSDDLSVRLQASGGGFGSSPFALEVEDEIAPLVAIADLEGDGDPDLLCSDRRGGLVATATRTNAFLQRGPGEFLQASLGLPIDTGEDEIGDDTHSVLKAADLNGDGLSDLVALTDLNSRLELYYQRAPFPPTPDLERSGFFPLEVADIDLDGDIDLLTGTSGVVGTSIRLQGTLGEFGFLPDIVLPVSSGPTQVVDFDVDGRPDLMVVNGVALQPRAGFEDGILPPVLTLPASLRIPQAVDLDADGDLDVAGTNSPLALILERTGDSAFGEALLLASSDDGPLVIDDLDGDGRPDALVPGFGSLSGYYQPLGGFQSLPLEEFFLPGAVCRPSSHGQISFATTDPDQDGDRDIISVRCDGSLALWRQAPPGIFGPDEGLPALELTDPPLMIEARTVLPLDLDGDGDVDLASTNLTSKNVTVFFNSH